MIVMENIEMSREVIETDVHPQIPPNGCKPLENSRRAASFPESSTSDIAPAAITCTSGNIPECSIALAPNPQQSGRHRLHTPTPPPPAERRNLAAPFRQSLHIPPPRAVPVARTSPSDPSSCPHAFDAALTPESPPMSKPKRDQREPAEGRGSSRSSSPERRVRPSSPFPTAPLSDPLQPHLQLSDLSASPPRR
eukprot:CAMPEP_0172174986 /NCGR_PEP_ID=MMETSP1050-20130122/13970_1 /TAXON_ID=233186 /ORGANISM="Cryptomonas curvata, Strain CCAP979/52" /LENGTH=193 /DNA_ID=CAMNT_0012847025 /DNA_START=162 /DNA_END=739 /DNA_ORIENTATION=+